ncbi:MAG: phytoene desaturase [Deltaproteobacteria bacterium]|nr:phytoene desaturase [Deltaproteobacteria bacterium]
MMGEVRAAVIGAGLGGLAAAIRLQSAGVRTTLFEALDRPGGRGTQFRERGFVFDAGPTVITAPECLEELYALSGRRLAEAVELLPVRPFYRLAWHDGDGFDYGVELEQTLEQIRRRDPLDVDGYLRFLDFSRRNYEAGYGELVSTAFLRPWDMLRVAPKLAALRADRPVFRTVSRFVRDERLRQALSFHTLLIGGSPLETSSIYTLIHYLERQGGVHYPRGGVGALVGALARLFEELGGEFRPAMAVRRIEPAADGRHRLTAEGWNGPPFHVVVSNADLHHTYAKLLDGDPRAVPMRRRLERMRWSMSLFLIYFGTDRTWPELRQHTILFGPRYEGLLREIFRGRSLPEDFSLYLHCPTATDPSLAPPGCASFYVLSPVPHLGNAPLDWAAEAPAYAERILRVLERTLLPGLRGRIVVRSVATPEDFRSRLGAFHGNGFSVAPLLRQSAWFRPHNRDPRIPGLYVVGAGTHPGAGVPGVINSAKATVRVILEDLGRPPLEPSARGFSRSA